MTQDLRAISQRERSLRHKRLLEAFESLNEQNDPWMSRLSENDADIIAYIHEFPREASSIYSWVNNSYWTSLSPTRIAGMFDGNYNEIYYEDIKSISPKPESDSLSVNNILFSVPETLHEKFQKLIKLMTSRVD